MSDSSLSYQHKPLPHWLNTMGVGLCIAGLTWIIAAFYLDQARASFDYLIMLLFLASMAAGALFLIAVGYVIGSEWSVPYRRVTEFLAALVVPLAILAFPLLFFIHDLFHWVDQEAIAADQVLRSKVSYLNPAFFVARMALIFGAWLFFFILMTRSSRRQDDMGTQDETQQNVKLSAVFLIVFAISLTVLAIDWIASLEPHWRSTIIGIYYFAGTVLAALSLVTFSVVCLQENGYLHPSMSRDSYSTLGTLMFAFTIFWAYIAFSQYLLIWYANLPEETFWYIDRTTGDWAPVALGLIAGRFVIPFLVLLPRPVRTSPRWLIVISVWILFAHYYDLYWLVMPTYSKTGHPVFSWIDLGFLLLPIGLAMSATAIQSQKRRLVPVNDPKLAQGLCFRR